MKQAHKKIRDKTTTKTTTRNDAQGHTLFQCMNTLQRPNRTKKHQLSPVKMSPSTSLTKKSKHRFSPITVPGTPDPQNDKTSSSSLEVGVSTITYEMDNKEQDEDTDDELNDLFLYYKAFNKNPPEVDKSNAESAARHQAIDDEYRRLKQ